MKTFSHSLIRLPLISALGVLCAAQFVLQLDFSIVNVALPTIQRDLGFAPADLQWVVTGYALTFGSLLILGGRVGDLLGRRRLLMLSLTLFGLASLACGLAISPLMQILARLVQGGAAAFVSPSALSLTTTTYAEGAARNRALSLWQASTAAGATAGVIAGGILTQSLGWRAIFLVNVPIIAVLLLLIPQVIPDDKKSTSSERIDILGAALVTASAAALIYGLSNGQQQGFTSLVTVLALVASVLLAGLFVVVERSAPAPMVPFSYFSSRMHRASVGTMFLMGAVIAAYVYFISLYMQRVLGTSALLTGIALIPATATVVLTTTFVTRRLLDRLGTKRLLLIGLAVMIVGQVWFFFIRDNGSYLLNVLPGLLLTSLGMGLSLPTIAIGATTGVKHNEQGLAGGLLTSSQQVGSAVGLALLATTAAARTEATGSLAAGYSLSFLVGTGILLVAMERVAALLNQRARQSKHARQEADQTRTEETLAKDQREEHKILL
jgi:EmrB/QacA subfamily drug resistance transporter